MKLGFIQRTFQSDEKSFNALKLNAYMIIAMI